MLEPPAAALDGARREAPEVAPPAHLPRDDGGEEVAVAALVAARRDVVELAYVAERRWSSGHPGRHRPYRAVVDRVAHSSAIMHPQHRTHYERPMQI